MTVSSINVVGRTGQPHATEWTLTTVLHHTQKMNSKWIKDFNGRLETIKLLQESIGIKLLDLFVVKIVLDLTSKGTAIKAKIKKWDCVVQSLSRVQLFATPWTAACQASLSITISWSLLKLMSIESVMPPNHLTLCHHLLLLPSIFSNFRAFQITSN